MARFRLFVAGVMAVGLVAASAGAADAQSRSVSDRLSFLRQAVSSMPTGRTLIERRRFQRNTSLSPASLRCRRSAGRAQGCGVVSPSRR
jgi:hypothetical protein